MPPLGSTWLSPMMRAVFTFLRLSQAGHGRNPARMVQAAHILLECFEALLPGETAKGLLVVDHQAPEILWREAVRAAEVRRRLGSMPVARLSETVKRFDFAPLHAGPRERARAAVVARQVIVLDETGYRVPDAPAEARAPEPEQRVFGGNLLLPTWLEARFEFEKLAEERDFHSPARPDHPIRCREPRSLEAASARDYREQARGFGAGLVESHQRCLDHTPEVDHRQAIILDLQQPISILLRTPLEDLVRPHEAGGRLKRKKNAHGGNHVSGFLVGEIELLPESIEAFEPRLGPPG